MWCFDKKMVNFKEVEYQHKPLNTSPHNTLISWTLFHTFMSSKTQMSKDYNTHSHTCLIQPLVWTQGSNRANYWSRWAPIRLLPSGLTTATSTEKKSQGAWRAERRAGRGARALQLNVCSGDDPPPGWGELEAEVARWCVIWEHIAFWLQPSSALK